MMLFSFLLVIPWVEALEMVDMTHVFNHHTIRPPIFHDFKLFVRHNGTVDNTFWLQYEDYYSATHLGTHMDAPCHFIRGAKCIDELPIERFIAPAAVVDVIWQAQQNRDYLVTIDDLQQWERETGETFDGKVVMIKTGWGRRWGDKKAFTGTDTKDETKLHSPGMSGDASRWLVSTRKPFGLGVETLSLDHGPSRDKIAHQILLGAGLYGLECVANMEQIPKTGAILFVFPMKIEHASGAPTRIIAIY